MLACTDAGRAKWVESLANEMGVPASFVFKRRLDGSETEVTGVSAQTSPASSVVIYDDMIRTGGSLIAAARAYRDAGAVSDRRDRHARRVPGRLARTPHRDGSVRRHRLHRQPPAGPRARWTVLARRLASPASWRAHLEEVDMKQIKVAAAVRQPDALRLGRQLGAAREAIARGPRRRRQRALPAGACDHRLRLRGRVLHGAGVQDEARSPARSARAADRGHGGRRSALPVYLREGALQRGGAARRRPDRRASSAKRFLAGDGIHYEPRWFKPWPAGSPSRAHPSRTAPPLSDRRSRVRRRRRRRSASRSARTPGSRPGPAPTSRWRGVDIISTRRRATSRSASSTCASAS